MKLLQMGSIFGCQLLHVLLLKLRQCILQLFCLLTEQLLVPASMCVQPSAALYCTCIACVNGSALLALTSVDSCQPCIDC
jgi:hypothetical protein